MVLSQDLDASREFSEKRLGLDVIEATDTAITYAWVACLIDPDGNALGIGQAK